MHDPDPRLTSAPNPPHRPAPSGLSTHILPTSATMVGVCMTVLSISHLRPGTDLHLIVDKILALDALVFMASATMSFMSMRTRRLAALLEARAELLFLTGLGLLTLGAVVLAFAVK